MNENEDAEGLRSDRRTAASETSRKRHRNIVRAVARNTPQERAEECRPESTECRVIRAIVGFFSAFPAPSSNPPTERTLLARFFTQQSHHNLCELSAGTEQLHFHCGHRLVLQTGNVGNR